MAEGESLQDQLKNVKLGDGGSDSKPSEPSPDSAPRSENGAPPRRADSGPPRRDSGPPRRGGSDSRRDSGPRRYGGGGGRDDRGGGGGRDDRGDSGGGRYNRRRRYHHRKVCAFCVNKAKYIDYKDVGTLSRFVTERSKIKPARMTGVCSPHQRQLTEAIKRARNLALIGFKS